MKRPRATPLHVKRWYAFVKDQPCAACGFEGDVSDPVEVAHVRCLISPKTGDVLPRSHHGLAAYSALPLHRSEHEELHRTGEQRWLDQHIGLSRAFALIATLIACYYLEEEEEP